MKDTELVGAVEELFEWAKKEYKWYSNVAPEEIDSYSQGKVIGSMATYYKVGEKLRIIFPWLREL